jgi:flagellar hook-associated protein FlgK
MNAPISIALSGLQAAQSRLGVAGHNLANLGTAGFRRQTVEAAAVPGGGVAVSIARAPSPGAAIEEDLVGLLQAEHAFKANLAVFKAHDRMLGGLLDTQA